MKIRTITVWVGAIVLAVFFVAGFFVFFLGPRVESQPQEREQGMFNMLFPFLGQSETGEVVGGEEENLLPQESAPLPRLRKITTEPVVSVFVFEEEGRTLFRFIEASEGHVFQGSTDQPTLERLTNTTLVGLSDTLWLNKNTFIARFFGGSVENVIIALEEFEDEVLASFRGDGGGWSRIAHIPGQGAALVVEETSNGSRIERFENGTRTLLSVSPISSWVPLASANATFLYSAPLSNTPGYVFQVQNNTLTKVAEALGLVAVVDTAGNYALISSGEGSGGNLVRTNLSSGERDVAPLYTIATKCVFLPDPAQAVCGVPSSLPLGEYPNDWLLGSVEFLDAIWRIDFEQSSATFLVDAEDAGEFFDVWQPTLSPNGEYFFFLNKNDRTLWSLRLSEEPAQ